MLIQGTTEQQGTIAREEDSEDTSEAEFNDDDEGVPPLRKYETEHEEDKDELEELRPRSREKVHVGRVPRAGRRGHGVSRHDYRVTAGESVRRGRDRGQQHGRVRGNSRGVLGMQGGKEDGHRSRSYDGVGGWGGV